LRANDVKELKRLLREAGAYVSLEFYPGVKANGIPCVDTSSKFISSVDGWDRGFYGEGESDTEADALIKAAEAAFLKRDESQ